MDRTVHKSKSRSEALPWDMEASYYILAKWEKQPDGVWRMSRGLQSPVDAPPEG